MMTATWSAVWAQSSAAPLLDVIDQQPVSVWFATSAGKALTAHVTLLLSNKGPTVVVTPALAAHDASDGVVTGLVQPAMVRLDSNTVVPVRFTISLAGDALPQLAQLAFTVVTEPGGRALLKPVQLRVLAANPPAFFFLILPGFAAALVIVTIAYSRRRQSARFSTPMGPPQWDFKATWASNITVVGSVLTSLLAFSALPNETGHLSRSAYMAMGLLWTLVIALAPALYNFFRVPVAANPGAAAGDAPAYDGCVGGFLLACVFTLWAVFGQLATLATLFDELEPAHLVPMYAVELFWLLLALITVGLAFYAFRTVEDTIDSQRDGARTSALRETARPAWHPL
jgi:hypothetical protein